MVSGAFFVLLGLYHPCFLCFLLCRGDTLNWLLLIIYPHNHRVNTISLIGNFEGSSAV